MSMNTTALSKTRGFSEEALKEISWSKSEPEWLLQRRLEAWRLCESMPLPTRKEEEWRRTDLSMLDLDSVVPSVGGTDRVQRLEELPEGLRLALGAPRRGRRGDGETRRRGDREAGRSGDEDAPPSHAGKGAGGLGLPRAGGLSPSEPSGALLVQHNSLGIYRYLPSELVSKGVILSDLDSAVRKYPDLVKRHLMAYVSPAANKFAALNAAFWSGGAIVYVPRYVEVRMPVHALTWSDSPGLGVMPHTLLIVEPGASLTFVEEFASPQEDAPAVANGVLELSLGEGAHVQYVSLQRWADTTFNFTLQRAAIGRDAELASLSVVLGSKVTKSWVEAALLEPGASARLSGIMFGGGQQRFHHHTLQDHQAASTNSDLLFKGALVDQARSEFSGLIRVHPDAWKTDAYQANRNLLLSPNARADSMPKLEILNNDVRCTHGATVGPIDPEQLFYLMSRGLSQAAAEWMIVQGFFEPLIERIPLESVRAKVRLAVDEKLSTGAP